MDKARLRQDLVADYQKTHPRSAIHFQDSLRSLIGGGSHNLRLIKPFPFYDARCSGSKVVDIDGNTYVDFWQGHFGNILGHNPPVVLNVLAEYLAEGRGLATGFPGIYQEQLASLILERISADKLRFTTSGTLATMYAIMLSKSFTGKNMVVKIGGGWHGAQPYALKGISVFKSGLSQVESAGLPAELDAALLLSEFNNIEDLEEKFRHYGDKIACLIMEPFIGAGGFIFGTPEYIQGARDLTSKYGALLVFDEVVSGFRFHAGALQSLYNVKADLTVFGKAIGGGMPVSALAGRGEIMELCDSDAPNNKRVKFEGGTFSGHPACMLAGLTFLRYLIEHEEEVYPRLGKLGDIVRKNIPRIFNEYGFNVKCTGGDSVVSPNSSVVGVHFLNVELDALVSPEEVGNPE
ncbi:MAG: aminotransferase class III-fold pyridoxal phosphate-dependent enzyme, partial [Candidatus Aminicenantes bacterium]|nr:aminotransferase class III-fold pyridoxal phosphate-dependent enzyme [Candidatus Aminicenantes bacterium]